MFLLRLKLVFSARSTGQFLLTDAIVAWSTAKRGRLATSVRRLRSRATSASTTVQRLRRWSTVWRRWSRSTVRWWSTTTRRTSSLLGLLSVSRLLLSNSCWSGLSIEDNISGTGHLTGSWVRLSQAGLISANSCPEAIVIGDVINDTVETIGVSVSVWTSNGASVVRVFSTVLRVTIVVFHIIVEVVRLWSTNLHKKNNEHN